MSNSRSNSALSKPALDATIIAGDVSNLWANGILCYTEKAFKFVDSHPLAVGHWHNDTFWMKLSNFSKLADLTMDMVKAGLIVE